MEPIVSYQDQRQELELNMQALWKAEKVNATAVGLDGPKRYVLGMFPYPSGNAHMGHALVYSLSDTIARLGRFKGENVLHPLGWDSFGLPAENAAIKNNVHPASWTQMNIATMRDEQIGRMGFSFDEEHELNTSSPEYYKWSQWLFLQLHKAGLVYRAMEWVNWDPVDQTVLANEQVVDGKGWRSNAPIERRKMEQWYIRITEYAQQLWDGLDELPNWSDAAKGAQRNWIGRTEGIDVQFMVKDRVGDPLTVFTTSPETLFGTAAVILPPEDGRAAEIASPDKRAAVAEYQRQALLKSEVERVSAEEMTYVDTGALALHPLTGKEVPVLVAEHVTTAHGLYAAACVPACNERDHKLATAAGLEIVPVFADDALINSGAFDGMETETAASAISDALESQNVGKRGVHWRLRDWSIGRQRFWGAPIPMVLRQDGEWEPVAEDKLPVMLPTEIDFAAANGQSPLMSDSVFRNTADAAGGPALRETDTMDTFMCSAWYVWRFLNPKNNDAAWTKEDAFRWMPVDYYVGGLEHANQHLIYLRFMSHFLNAQGLTPTKEPVTSFLDNGMIQMDGKKMSKSRGNVVRPDHMIEKYSADALHMTVLSDGPFQRNFDWNENGLVHKQQFLNRVFRLFKDASVPQGVITLNADDAVDPWSRDLLTKLHAIAVNVDKSIEVRKAFHVAIAHTHEMANELMASRADVNSPTREKVYGFALQGFLKMLGLTAPHISDYLWRDTFGVDSSLFKQPWVSVDSELRNVATGYAVPVTINGRKRAEIEVTTEEPDTEIIARLFGEDDDYGLRPHLGHGVEKSFVIRDKREQKVRGINLALKKGPNL